LLFGLLAVCGSGSSRCVGAVKVVVRFLELVFPFSSLALLQLVSFLLFDIV
jgi:hypothetical protein